MRVYITSGSAFVAYGTADQADERSMTYGATGQLLTLTDGENNRTSYDYDAHDRLLATHFPVPAKGALASSMDAEVVAANVPQFWSLLITGKYDF